MDSKIVELAKQILANTNSVDEFLRSHDLPQPSFSVDGPVDFGIDSAEVESLRLSTIEATIELQDLLLGPTMLLRPIYNGTSLQAIYKFGIAKYVPIHGEIAFTELAKLCDIYEPDLRRILRFAMCYYRCFREPRKGFVAHTATSRSIVERAGVEDTLGVMFDECWQSYACTVEAMTKFKSRELNESGYSLAQNTELPFYQYLKANPEKGKRFTGAMQAFGEGPDLSPSFLVQAYPWKELATGTVVDLGGSNGSVGAAIAEAFPDLSIIVQDMPEVVNAAIEQEAPPKSRIRFMAHDFFTEQPVSADLYLFRYIFHNWPDQYATKILRQLIPVLKPGARILVNDHLLPEPNTASLTTEREIRSMDMLMLTLCNARERDRDDWETLFKTADSRFHFVNAYVPAGSSLGIIEASWEP